MAHQLGAVYDTPHGGANALLLPYVVRYNGEVCEQKYREILGDSEYFNKTQKEILNNPEIKCENKNENKNSITFNLSIKNGLLELLDLISENFELSSIWNKRCHMPCCFEIKKKI